MMYASAPLSARWRVWFTMICLNKVELKYDERSRSVQGSRNFHKILPESFDRCSVILRKKSHFSEADPKKTRT